MKKKKKRVAFFGVGVVNVGQHSGVPSFVMLLDNLGETYDITLYRLSLGKVFLKNIKICSLPFSFLPSRINYLFIILTFIFHHIQKKYAVINALSARPSGKIAVFLGKIFKIPVVLHLLAAEVICLKEIEYGDICNSAARSETLKICEGSNTITVLTQFQKNILEKTFSLKVPTKVIHHGCNHQLFTFNENEVRTPLRILYVGYNERVKDPLGALKAFSLIRKEMNASLTMIGRGLKEVLEINGISCDNIIFQEFLDFTQMPSYFHSADFLMVTSHCESQSSVATEAMSCGVLVCGTHVGILADLSGITCLTVKPGDYINLARTIIELSKDSKRQRMLRRNARQWAEKYDYVWSAHQYEQIFDSF